MASRIFSALVDGKWVDFGFGDDAMRVRVNSQSVAPRHNARCRGWLVISNYCCIYYAVSLWTATGWREISQVIPDKTLKSLGL